MARIPSEIDSYFILDILLIFLMINYNMPLATVYITMVIVGSLMYIVPVYSNLFGWIPFMKKGGNWIASIAWGAGFGLAFIYFYEYIQTMPNLGQVFATTAFGESIYLGKFVYGILIGIIETRFFFRTIMQWGAWRMGWPIPSSPFSKIGINMMIMFGAIFTFFHLTAKGVTNNIDLIATFVFGAMSIGMVIQFKSWIEAAIAHIVVNSKGVGIFDIFKAIPTVDPVWIIAGIIILYFVFTSKNRKGFRLPFLA